MSPEGPRFSPEVGKDKKKDKKSSKKENNVLVPSALLSLENNAKDQPAPTEPSTIEKALAELVSRRAGKAVAPEQPEKSAKTVSTQVSETAEPEPENAPERVVETEGEPEPEAEDTEDAYETLADYEPEPTEFSGGEVIVRLSGDTPVAERVIPLQAEAKPEPESKISHAATAAEQFVVAASGHVPRSAEQPTAPAGGDVPPVPPEGPVSAAEQPPEAPRHPMAETFSPDAVRLRDMAPFAPNSERPATKQDVEDALYYAEKSGQNRGVLTGLLVGGAYEHFKHKRREKKVEKRFKQQTKQLEQVRKDYNFTQQAQAKQQHEFSHAYNTLEKRVQKSAQPEKLTAKKQEQPQLAQGEQLHIPENHRLETSAWHTIEVDAKTGKAVEKPAFAYGHEYYQERAAENAPVQRLGAAAGEVALVAAAAGSNLPSGSSAASPPTLPNVPDASTQGPPPGSVKDKTKSARDAAIKPTAAGPLWPWLAALAVILILLAILL